MAWRAPQSWRRPDARACHGYLPVVSQFSRSRIDLLRYTNVPSQYVVLYPWSSSVMIIIVGILHVKWVRNTIFWVCFNKLLLLYLYQYRFLTIFLVLWSGLSGNWHYGYAEWREPKYVRGTILIISFLTHNFLWWFCYPWLINTMLLKSYWNISKSYSDTLDINR